MREETLNRALSRYEQTPHLVFWETTKACSLACRHCRASAQTEPLAGELSTQEGFDLIDQIAEMPGMAPILVFTGGDCFARADLSELIGHARERSIRVGIAPSVTERLTRERMQELFELGVRSVSISLDGANAQSHDSLRGIPGHFEKTLEALQMMRDMGFRLQVNTTVMKSNALELAEILALLNGVGVSIWEVFFLVGVGRGAQIQEVDPEVAEDVCHFLADTAMTGMTVRTVEAPFYRRVLAQREKFADENLRSHFALGETYDLLHADMLRRGLGARKRDHGPSTLATGDGRGIVFVGYDGDVHASGFLPISLGNVRQETLGSIYADDPLLTSLRAGLLEGECGQCDYRRLCGGSRARAYARTGRVLEDDPACIRTKTGKRIALPMAI
ncbi:MAG: TIGR04053 family radical SAM/SPASM domain-containing protein [Acidimicrobiaceae bacterium]|nr:TIGR04053 family radical SAM/SPASM domain-containing protein [Acidimicrobiaceae bacterium]